MNFLDKLNFLMRRDGDTTASLSRKSGIPYTTIDNFAKRGYEGVRMQTIQKIADHYHVTIDYLVRDEITEPQYDVTGDPELQRLIDQYKQLDSYSRFVVCELIRLENARSETPAEDYIRERTTQPPDQQAQ